MVVWVVWLAASWTWAVECAAPVAPAEIEAAMTTVEAAFRDLDEAGFRDGVNELAALRLPCVDQALTPDQAARYHRLMALHLHGLGDEVGALAALTAAHALAPTQPIPEDLAPPVHPLQQAWPGLPTDTPAARVPEPKYGKLAFDGSFTRDRPRDRPALVQLFDASGVPSATRYLDPREPLPAYAAIPRRRNALIGCSGGAVAASVGAWAAAWATRGGVYGGAEDMTTAGSRLDGGRAATNALTVSSAALLGVSAGCGVAAAAIGPR